MIRVIRVICVICVICVMGVIWVIWVIKIKAEIRKAESRDEHKLGKQKAESRNKVNMAANRSPKSRRPVVRRPEFVIILFTNL